MSINAMAKAVAKYINTLHDFEYVDPLLPYNHMGATITDAILQSGINYETVVKPRVEKILRYSKAKTTSGFLDLIKNGDLKNLLNWHDSEKPHRIIEATKFFAEEGIETEAQLKDWLDDDENTYRLDAIRGIGDKTIDYFKILSGGSTTAIDRHLLNFLRRVGISVNGYSEAREIINSTADMIGKQRTLLDHSVWKYMSSKKQKKCVGKGKTKP